jgi:CRP-like cAMP-binding protein
MKPFNTKPSDTSALSCKSCASRATSDWADLPEHCFEIIDRVKRPRQLEQGETLFCEGEENLGLHCVSAGIFGLKMTHENGTRVLVGVASPGDTLGSRAFLRNGPHRTTAEALTPSAVCTILRRDALHLTQAAPTVYLQLVKRCLRAMDDAQEDKLRMAAMSNRARLCHLLIRLIGPSQTNSDQPVEARLPVSRVDLAGMIGIQPESVSRLFRRIKDDGLIDFNGRHLRIPSLARLAAEANADTANLDCKI